MLFYITSERYGVKRMRKTERTAASKTDVTGSWRNFGAFLRHAKLSWGWIAASLVLTMVYYVTVSKLPGSTA